MPAATGSIYGTGLEYFDGLLELDENVEIYSKLREYYATKQYYEFGKYLEQLSRDEFEVPINFLDLYKANTMNLQIYIDPVVRSEILFNIAFRHENDDEILDLLGTIDKTYTEKSVAYIVAKLAYAAFYIRYDQLVEGKNYLIDSKEMISNLRNVTPAHAYYYKMKSLYYERANDASKYHRVTLKYLGCIKLDDLNEPEKQKYAYNLAIASIISATCYSLSELANHPVMQSLSTTDTMVLCRLLKSIGKYDLQSFNSCREYIRSVPNLELNFNKIMLKLKISGLTEICSSADVLKGEPVTFNTISEKLKIHLDDVEIFLMKVFALNYVRGKIDEKNAQVFINYIQPKSLDIDEIDGLKNRLAEWIKYGRLASAHLYPLDRFLQQQNN